MEDSDIPSYTSEKELHHKNHLPHILIIAAVLVISGIWFANYMFKQNSEKSHAAEALPQSTTPIFQYFKLQPNDGASSTVEKTQTAISPTVSPTPVTVKPEALSVVYPPLTTNSVRVIVKKSNSTESVIEKIEAFHKDGTVIATHSYNQEVAMNQAAYSEDIPCNSNEDVQINTHVLNNNRETVYLTNTQCGKEDTVSVVDNKEAVKDQANGNKAENSQSPAEVGIVKIYNDNIYPHIHWSLDEEHSDVQEYDHSNTSCLPLPPLFPDKITVTYPHGDGMTYYFLRGACAVGFDLRVSSPNYPAPTATPGPVLSAPTLTCGAYDSAHNTFSVSVGWAPSDLVASYVSIDGPNDNLYNTQGNLHSPQTASNIPADIGLNVYYWVGTIFESPHTHIVCPKPPTATPTPPNSRPTLSCGSYQGNGLFTIRMDWQGGDASDIITRDSQGEFIEWGSFSSPHNIQNRLGNIDIKAAYSRGNVQSDWSNTINCQIPFQSPTPTGAPVVTLRSSITNPSNNSSGITVTHMYYEASGVAHVLDMNHSIAKGESWTAPTYNAACDNSNTFNVGVTYTINGQTETANSSNINCDVVAHVNVPIEAPTATPVPPTPTSLPGATATPRPPTSTPRPPTPTPWRFYRCSTGSNCTLVFQNQCRGEDRYCGSDQATCNSICGQPATSSTPVPPVATATPRPPTATPTPTIVYSPLNLYFSNQNVAPWLRVTSIVYYDQVAHTTHTEHPNVQIASGAASSMPTVQCNSLNGNYTSILVEYLLPNNVQQYVAVDVQCGGVNNGHLFNQANTGYPPAATPTPHPTRPPAQCQSPQTIQTGCGPYGDGYQSCLFSSQGGSCHRVSCGVCYF